LKLENISVIVSIISILMSLSTAYFQRRLSKKSQKISLESIYYKEIYWKYLVGKIPDAREYVQFANSTKEVTDTDRIEEVLIDMRRDSLFFKFTDLNFYDSILFEITNIENKYVTADKMIYEKYIDFEKEVDSLLNEVYDMILSKYLGEK
jgi:hypothetical protein